MADEPNKTPTQPQPDAALTRARQLIDKLWNDGKLGPSIRAEAKKLFPDITIPEDTLTPVIEPLAAENKALKERLDALQKQFDDKTKAEAESAQNASFDKLLSDAKSKYGLTEEGFNKMVERMKTTKNYTDAEAAAAWVAGQEVPAKPVSGPSWAPQDLNLYDTKTKNEDNALLHRDPVGFFDKEVANILNEAGTA